MTPPSRWRLSSFQEDFPVVDESHLLGVLSRAQLLRALADGSADARVRELMMRDVAVADVNEPIVQAMQRLDRSEPSAMPVLERGVLVGLLTPRRIGEIVMTRA